MFTVRLFFAVNSNVAGFAFAPARWGGLDLLRAAVRQRHNEVFVDQFWRGMTPPGLLREGSVALPSGFKAAKFYILEGDKITSLVKPEAAAGRDDRGGTVFGDDGGAGVEFAGSQIVTGEQFRRQSFPIEQD
jgi:hypothetical protein